MVIGFWDLSALRHWWKWHRIASHCFWVYFCVRLGPLVCGLVSYGMGRIRFVLEFEGLGSVSLLELKGKRLALFQNRFKEDGIGGCILPLSYILNFRPDILSLPYKHFCLTCFR
ncbi:hypothetical protein AOQ84DRAFT_15208 [Glonium stellatum]|uniref:Uncharacterized protein n=1 Tax=Glonium stellatum TaxID=574774 RepID=A0A8E2F3D6_9PEZI|nr:hypothetical protein AOQ84DRAFT_15208 [Glonium stellatum]